jgi:hypothetical protein
MTERHLERGGIGGIIILTLRSGRYGENNFPCQDSRNDFSVHRMIDQKYNENVRK